jgi:hypothetical protein
MATVPPTPQDVRREHPLITIGVVLAILLAGLLALPFIAHARHQSSRQTISVVAPHGRASASTLADSARHF